MKETPPFKDKAAPRTSVSPVCRLALAIYGKHPAWDDHIRGVGSETPLIAQSKSVIYEGGIRDQIDSGAWEKLDSEKRLPGFDHTVLWLRGRNALLATLSSSHDGKGRSEYPLVLAVDANGVAPPALIKRVFPELQRLKAGCEQSHSNTRVTDECGFAQERLDRIVEQLANDAQPEPDREARSAFLHDPSFGADRAGLLRVMHEIENARQALGAQSAAGSVVGLFHCRLPAPKGPSGAWLLWIDFLREALPGPVPIMLIARQGTDWLDVILGEPAANDFFCLQAAPGALPLASSVPYELSPELSTRLTEVEHRFLSDTAQESVPKPSPVSIQPMHPAEFPAK